MVLRHIWDDHNKQIRHLAEMSDLFCEQGLRNNFPANDN